MVFIYGYIMASLLYAMYIYCWAKNNKKHQEIMKESELGSGLVEFISLISALVVGLIFPVDITNRIKNKIKERKGE